MSIISVSHLFKHYQVPEKEPGFMGSLKSLFKKKYKEVKAVDDISFSIEEGELIGFIGPNGAGKTTTLKCLSGLLSPDKNNVGAGFDARPSEVKVLGYDPFQRKSSYLKNITLVMGQKNQLNWDLPAMETFLLFKEIYEISTELYQKNLNELVTLLTAEKLINVPVRKLSLGERMKCELIASLLHAPKVIFLDEPTLGLDVVAQKNMRDFIKMYNQKYQATIILTSHYMEDVKELCKRIIMVSEGKIIYDGLLSAIIQKYADHKTLEVVFGNDIDPKKLAEIGEVESYDFPKAAIHVPREKSNLAAANLLKNFPVIDLNITETSIEDIIREIFTK